MKDRLPLILVHYGISHYLRSTLENAVRMNPDKRVILIGDHTNMHLSSIGVEHFTFEDLVDAGYKASLDSCYKVIGGTKFLLLNTRKGGEDWTYFNFMKWHVIDTLCSAEGIDSFWTFDSDVIYTRPLSELESSYSHYDYTTVNTLHVMQGMVNNTLYLRHFSNLVIELFSDGDFLESMSKDFQNNPTFGFTMMRVFDELKKRHRPNTLGLIQEVDGLRYDSCICMEYDSEEFYPGTTEGRRIKKLYVNKGNEIFQKQSETGEYFGVFAINMSWVPTYFIRMVNSAIYSAHSSNSTYSEISIRPPFSYTISKFLRKTRDKISYEWNNLNKKESK